MKTTKLIIGIISLVLFGLICFQSCAAGVANTLGDTGEAGGSAGIILAVFILVAGIVAIAARKSFGGTITSAVFYLVGGIIAVPMAGSYADLKIWGTLSIIFAVLFIIIAILQKKNNKKAITQTEE